MSDDSQFREGEMIRVVSGPLAGFEGVVTGFEFDRVTLDLIIFGRTTPALLRPSDLESLDDPRP